MKTLLLTQGEISPILTMKLTVSAVERAFAAHGRGETQMPPKVYLSLEEHAGDFRAMPSCFGTAAGLKWVNSHTKNPARHGLPAVMALYILSDPATAIPLAVMDGTLLTAVRTGAGAGVATKHLAKKKPGAVGYIGCGVQARTLHAAHLEVIGPHEVRAADVSREAAEKFASEVGGKVVSIEEAAGCDIVCTMTPAREPVVKRAWIRPGAHVNAVGADAHGKQELDPAILRDAKVIVDDVEQASGSGEVNVPLHTGEYRADQIHATLGEVITGKKPGREGDAEITVFDSTGLAVQDLAVAQEVYEEARRRGVGREIDFSA